MRFYIDKYRAGGCIVVSRISDIKGFEWDEVYISKQYALYYKSGKIRYSYYIDTKNIYVNTGYQHEIYDNFKYWL